MHIYGYINTFKGGGEQKDHLKEYANNKGHKIKYTFEDVNAYDKDNLYSLLELLEEGNTKKVLVYNTDVLWSDDELHYLIVNKFIKLGADIVSISEPNYSVYKDDIIHNGKSILELLIMLNKGISNTHLAEARQAKAEQGKKPCGTAPLGYMWSSEGDILTNETEIDIVVTIFEKYVKLKSLSKLESYLKEEKIYTRNDSLFQRGTLQKILRNDFYIGKMTYDNKTIQGRHTGIIDSGLFYEANDLLSSNTRCTKKQY